MNEGGATKSAREERLAAKLRENLRRRKVQSREMAAQPTQDGPPNGVPKPREES